MLDQSTHFLEFLNNKQSTHQNIKPANILLDKSGDIKLAGFGTGDQIDKEAAHRMFTQQKGTIIYMAISNR